MHYVKNCIISVAAVKNHRLVSGYGASLYYRTRCHYTQSVIIMIIRPTSGALWDMDIHCCKYWSSDLTE